MNEGVLPQSGYVPEPSVAATLGKGINESNRNAVASRGNGDHVW